MASKVCNLRRHRCFWVTETRHFPFSVISFLLKNKQKLKLARRWLNFVQTIHPIGTGRVQGPVRGRVYESVAICWFVVGKGILNQ